MREDIETVLRRAEDAVAEGGGVSGIGFWRAVAATKRDTDLVERYADRIASIDRCAFENGVRMRVPLWFGLLLLSAVSAAGIIAVTAARFVGGERFFGDPLYEIVGGRVFVPAAFLGGLVALLVGTHSLVHFLVGRLVGIRFTHVFLGGPPPPRPGVKTDYASYLRASPTARAVMHASGAVVSKIVPFALLAASLPLYDEWPWLTWVLLALGAVQVVTDVLLSTKTSDWKKVRRELGFRSGS